MRIWFSSFVFLVNTGFDLIFRDQTRIKILFWISGWKTTGNYHLTQIWFRSRFFFLFSVASFVFRFRFLLSFSFQEIHFCFVLKHTVFVEKKEREILALAIWLWKMVDSSTPTECVVLIRTTLFVCWGGSGNFQTVFTNSHPLRLKLQKNIYEYISTILISYWEMINHLIR